MARKKDYNQDKHIFTKKFLFKQPRWPVGFYFDHWKTFKFKEVGRFNEMIWDRGKYVSLILVALMQEDWIKRNNN